jgi:hypothetical protein
MRGSGVYEIMAMNNYSDAICKQFPESSEHILRGVAGGENIDVYAATQ